MSTLDIDTSSSHSDNAGPDNYEEDNHDALFWQVGLILAVLTALEVSTYWWEQWFSIETRITSAVLIVMMVIKFMMIAMYFMHLKWDAKILRGLFFGGFFLAMACYAGALGASRYFQDSGNDMINDPPDVKAVPTTVAEG